ncbi:MAG: MFS transporter [Deltaproteobacteria bacterium]|nr:MFS transporter [Deltaproteobacteria bacterium]MBW1961401.1 MFS transporter [Deltaproteobacteria bacterium]MBW2152740.1 MFS transporter [Deltaproteobacteria bacterium]
MKRFSFPDMFESFRYRDFRWLWMGTFANFMALGMQMMARGWLVLRLSNDSPLALSLVMIAFALPMTCMSLVGGALADRIPRKYIIMAVQAGNALMTGLLATLDYTGSIRFWHLIAIGLVNGSLMSINMPSRQALISDIVPKEKLMNAISLNNSGTNLTRAFGPALAGVLIVYMDTAGVFYLIASCYIFSLLSVAMIRISSKPFNAKSKAMTRDIREGLKYAMGDSTLRGLIITLFMPVFFGFSLIILLPAWAREALQVQADDLGVLMMVMGSGSLVGSLILAALRNMTRRGRWLLINGVLWGATMIMFSQSTSYVAAMPFLFFAGFMSAIFMALNMTLLQIYSADEMRGRIMSIAMMSFGAMPLSTLPFGAVAEWIGTPNALCLSGAMLTILTVVFSLANPNFKKIN